VIRHSAIYEGTVVHRRFTPVEHRFRYRLFMLYIDLDELGAVFDGRLLWSRRRPAPGRFDRRDYHGDPDVPLHEAVRRTVHRETGIRPEGPIRLLTHARYFGHCFNPVSFYYCFDPDGKRVETVVAEVTNTPWSERHAYVMRRDDEDGDLRFAPEKVLHVSPFEGMDVTHDWRFTEPGPGLGVHMTSTRDGTRVFDAALGLTRSALTTRALNLALVRHPLMTARVVGAIHLEAARLWLKGAPFYPHPSKRMPAPPPGGAGASHEHHDLLADRSR